MKKNNWVMEFSIQKDGFHGHLFRPLKNDYHGRALLVLGGGGMPYQSTLDLAEAFTGLGITALAVGYFGVPNAPKTIVRVPIEYVENAAKKLHSMEMAAVIAVGFSKGAELALVSASLISQVNGVIALSPPSRVYMGVGKGISWVNESSWSFRGKELPYAYAPSSGMQALWYTFRKRELTFRSVYERANKTAPSDSSIPVESIQGPVFVAAAKFDSLWPAAEACYEMGKRLSDSLFPYPHKEMVYHYASHFLLPFETSYERLFRVGRKYPKECRQTVLAIRKEILEWLKQEYH